ncbi:MAG: AEC family transporter [Proteobacteria bacterium]|nr:AEC family transporter [Pseudomonadota bacterium]MBU1687296.1 AEC family transporter [Pseudomonadota bacterium]
MENFAITISFLLIGIILRRLPRFGDETGNVLNLFVIHVSLPALVLLKIPELGFTRALMIPVITPWLMLAVSAGLILGLATLFKWPRPITGCLLLMIPLGNTSFLGIPMVKAFFGEGAVSYAVIYDQLGSFLALATYGSVILALYGTQASRPKPQEIIKKIITFPPFIALILAFLLRPLQYPVTVVAILKPLSATLVPVVMIAVGFQLTLRLHREESGPLAVGLAIKLLIAPLIALVLYKSIGITGEATRVAIFEAAMPPMVSAGALAILADLSPPLTAALVGLGIILSFATLPLIFQLL